MDSFKSLVNKVYKQNEKNLYENAFVVDSFGFTRCVSSLMKEFDMRKFFGGMSAYHDGQCMAELLGVRSKLKFSSNFVDGKDGKSDPVAMLARIPAGKRLSDTVPLTSTHVAEADFCISVRVWDLLLWFAIMRRPRRDVGIIADFAKTLAEFSMQLLPRSIFPYDLVPMTRIDPMSHANVLMDSQFDLAKYGGKIFRPAVIPRNVGKITNGTLSIICPGKVGTKVMEDEAYMSCILDQAFDMDIQFTDFPIDQSRALTVHWEYGVSFPMHRYFDCLHFDPKRNGDASGKDGRASPFQDGGSDSSSMSNEYAFLKKLSGFFIAALYLNPSRHSMMLYVVDPSFDGDGSQSGAHDSMYQSIFSHSLGKDKQADGGPGWNPRVQLAHEFTLLPSLQPLPSSAAGSGKNLSGHKRRSASRSNGGAGRFRDEDDEDDNDDDESISSAKHGRRLWGGVTCGCSSVQDMQNRIFQMGFGPIPYFRRAGVLVHISASESEEGDDDAKMLGCIVAHDKGGCMGCTKSAFFQQGSGGSIPEDERCYFCQGHPFCEVLFHNPLSAYVPGGIEERESADRDTLEDEESGDDGEGVRKSSRGGDLHGRSRIPEQQLVTVPVTPIRAFMNAVPVGSRLLLSINSLVQTTDAFSPMRQGHLIKRVQGLLMSRSGNDPSPSGQPSSGGHFALHEGTKNRTRQMQLLMSGSGKKERSAVLDAIRLHFQCKGPSSTDADTEEYDLCLSLMSERDRQRAIKFAKVMGEMLVRCFLSVTSVLNCEDGFVCVAVSCERIGANTAGTEMKNMYVAPQHLAMGSSDKQWDSALEHICI
jgi:hypothetical protein